MTEGSGEFKKRLGIILTDDDLIGRTIDEAKQKFPLNPLIEAVSIYKNLRNHTDQEKQILIRQHFKNCNLERFILEGLEWFETYFGTSEEKKSG